VPLGYVKQKGVHEKAICHILRPKLQTALPVNWVLNIVVIDGRKHEFVVYNVRVVNRKRMVINSSTVG
jgi:hypothetical protein